MRHYHAKLRAALAEQLPARAHIVEEEFCHGVSEYLPRPKPKGVTYKCRTILLTLPPNGSRYGHNEDGEFWQEMFVPLPARDDAKL